MPMRTEAARRIHLVRASHRWPPDKKGLPSAEVMDLCECLFSRQLQRIEKQAALMAGTILADPPATESPQSEDSESSTR